jgi:Tol biopolymer transport system component
LVFYLDSDGYDVWTFDTVRGVKTPQTFGSASAQANIFPVWSPDGSRIAYTSYVDGKYFVYQKRADGASMAEVLLDGVDRYRFSSDWSPDGKILAYQEGNQGGWAIWVFPLEGDRKPVLFEKNPFSERDAAFSPDGRWLALSSNESGEYRVYVVPFPGPGGRWQISQGGGTSPRWRRDGRELFYLSSDNHLMAVDLNLGASVVEVGDVKSLFETRSYGVFSRFDVAADGERFVVPYEVDRPSTAIALVVNWLADLKR